MAVFNLHGIPAFIAIKNHPTSSTKQKNRYHRKQPRLKQQLHQSSTITKKYFIYFSNCHKNSDYGRKPHRPATVAALFLCNSVYGSAALSLFPASGIYFDTFKSSAVKIVQIEYYNTLPGG